MEDIIKGQMEDEMGTQDLPVVIEDEDEDDVDESDEEDVEDDDE